MDLSVIISNNFYNQLINEKGVLTMIKVEFLGPMAQEIIELEAETLAEVATQLQNIESIAPWLDKCAVAVNDIMTADLSMKLTSGDKISILPPVCGG